MKPCLCLLKYFPDDWRAPKFPYVSSHNVMKKSSHVKNKNSKKESEKFIHLLVDYYAQGCREHLADEYVQCAIHTS